MKDSEFGSRGFGDGEWIQDIDRDQKGIQFRRRVTRKYWAKRGQKRESGFPVFGGRLVLLIW